MPSEKFPRAPMWCALSLALSLGLTAIDADAAGLGRLSVQSGLGQPLRAELEVTSVGREEAPTLQVKLAPLSAFRAANLEFNPALTNIRFALDRRQDGTYLVRISSAHGRQRTVPGHDGRAHLGHGPGDPRVHRPARSAGVEEHA